MQQRAPWNLQDAFLNQVRKENVPVTVYLVNGYQLKGYVKAFDSFTVMIEQDGKQHLVYKHALSTLSPMKFVQLHHPPVDEPAGGTSAGPSDERP